MRKNELDIFRNPFEVFSPFAGWANLADWDRPFAGIKVDIVEHDDKHVVTAALPGYKKEDINVSLKDGVLSITAEHNDSKEEKDAEGHVIRSEIYRGKVQRSFVVGDAVKEEDIKASYNDGVLNLEIAKKEEPKPEEKTITIE